MTQEKQITPEEFTSGKEFICGKYPHLKHPLEGKNPVIDFELEELGKWLEEYAEAYHREKVKEGNEIAESLAQWSMRYPRDRIYGGSNDKMDGELIAIEERAKKYLKSKLTEEQK